MQVTMLLAHRKAADLHTRIRAALRFLKNVCAESCPTELAERTIQRLCAAAEDLSPIVRSDVAGSSLHRSQDILYPAGEVAIGEPASTGMDDSG
ncbi:MAG: hypothetical protein ABFE01_14660 [Phycisphaerales bacterium]